MPGRKKAAGPSRRSRGLRIFTLGAVALIAISGTTVAYGATDSGNGVMVQEEKKYTRAKKIAMWKEILEGNGEQLPDVSTMTTEEIEEGHYAAMMKYATPAEMPMMPACDGWEMLLPSCW
ncbi:hypothetical protein QFZ82_005667 [Streptomyces sp. V4I23]|uniref:hypothetical protein n=1 Tax=Streptomyces sp. V4I23 TaxID=3042282 RepID=UPI002788A668|nr:hypothetical protein [Streptomyces sp. V4I23]MDQ1011182.1 hypothetical protein [Streptomyces sp. V4I23]